MSATSSSKCPPHKPSPKTTKPFTNTRTALKKSLDAIAERRETLRRQEEAKREHRHQLAAEMGRTEYDPLVELRLQNELKSSEDRHRDQHATYGPEAERGGVGRRDGPSVGYSLDLQEAIRTRQLVEHFRARAQLAQAAVVVVDKICDLVDVDDIKLVPRPPPTGLNGGKVPLRQRQQFLNGLALATGDLALVQTQQPVSHEIDEDVEGDDSTRDAARQRRDIKSRRDDARRTHVWAQYEEIARRLQQSQVPHKPQRDRPTVDSPSGEVTSQYVADDLRLLLQDGDRLSGGIGERRQRANSVSNDGDEFPTSSDDAEDCGQPLATPSRAQNHIGRQRQQSEEWSYCSCSCHRALDEVCDVCSQCTCDDHSNSYSGSEGDCEGVVATGDLSDSQLLLTTSSPRLDRPKKRAHKTVDPDIVAKRVELQALRRALKRRARGLDHHSGTAATQTSRLPRAVGISSLNINSTDDDISADEAAKSVIQLSKNKERAVHVLNALLEDSTLLLRSSGQIRHRSGGDHPSDRNQTSGSNHRPQDGPSHSSMVPTFMANAPIAMSTVNERYKYHLWTRGAHFPQSQWRDALEANAGNPDDYKLLRRYQPPEIELHERLDFPSGRLFAASTFVQLADFAGSMGGGGGGEVAEGGGGSEGGIMVSPPTSIIALPPLSPANSTLSHSTQSPLTLKNKPHHHHQHKLPQPPEKDLVMDHPLREGSWGADDASTTSQPILSVASNDASEYMGPETTSGVFGVQSTNQSNNSRSDVGGGAGSGAVAYGVPDMSSPYEIMRLPPEFSSISSSKILEVVASDACDVILSSENIMRFVNVCVREGRRVGSADGEFDKVDSQVLRMMLWSSECTQHIRRFVAGTKGITEGIRQELADKRADVVDAVEDLAEMNHRVSKLSKELDGLTREVREAEGTLVYQASLLYSSSSTPLGIKGPPSKPIATIETPPLIASSGSLSTSARQQVPLRQPNKLALSTSARMNAPPLHILEDVDTGVVALSRLRQYLSKWSILRGSKSVTNNSSFTNFSSNKQPQQQGDDTSSLPSTGSVVGVTPSSFSTVTAIPGSPKTALTLTPLATLFATKGAAARLRAQQQRQEETSAGSVGGRSGSLTESLQPSHPPASINEAEETLSVDAAFTLLLDSLATRPKMVALWNEIIVNSPTGE